MSCGGIRAEWLVECSACQIDVEPGAFYDSRSTAMKIRNRAVHYESWLLTGSGQLLCPECAAEPPPHTTRASALTTVHVTARQLIQ